MLVKKESFGLNFAKVRNAVFNEAPKQSYNKMEDKKTKSVWSQARENEQANQGNNTIKVQYSDKDIDEQKSDEDTRIAVLKRRKSGSPVRSPWNHRMGSPRMGGLS